MIDITIIDSLIRIERLEEYLTEERRTIVAPMHYSREGLQVLWEVACRLSTECGWAYRRTREYFIFTALYLFSPVSIIRKMRKGLRRDLASVMGGDMTENNISHIVRHLLFKYSAYSDFQENCNVLYNASKEVLIVK